MRTDIGACKSNADWKNALKLLNNAPRGELSAEIFDSVLDITLASKKHEVAEGVFREMQRKGFEGTNFFLNRVLVEFLFPKSKLR